MKAWRLHDIGDIRLEEVEKPSLKEDEVLVAVKAAGICGSDVPRTYQNGAHKMPLVIGHEFSGEVVEASAGNESWVGERVGTFPLIPCKKCGPCQNKLYEMCRDYDYVGSRRDGAFAEYVTVPAWNLIELPENVSFEQAAMLEPIAVAVHAMRKGLAALETNSHIKDKKEVAIGISGLGTIGLLLASFLKEAGYENLYVVGNKDAQFALAEKLGIEKSNICDLRKENPTTWFSDKNLSLYFDCVGKSETVSLGAEVLSPSGVMVCVGNPYSDITFQQNTYWKILRNQLTLVGTWNSSFTKEASDDWHYVLTRLKSQSVHPEQFITHRLSIEELEKGLLIMRDKIEDYCKIIIE